MPDIYQYLNYRVFLKDYFSEQKKKRSAFSHQFFAQKANIKSSGFVLHVIKGERNLTRTVILKIAGAIGLNIHQTAYFEDLVAFDQAKTQSEREFYLNRVTQKRNSIRAKPLNNRQFELYSAWYHTVIRELIRIDHGSGTPVDIAKKLIPPVTPKQVKDSLNLQKTIGVLNVDEQGNYRQTEPFISCGGAVRNTMLVKYQKEMLRQAQEVWDYFTTEELSMHTVTLPINEEMLPAVREEIRCFKSRLLELANSVHKAPDRVYHFNINAFPVTKSVKEGKE